MTIDPSLTCTGWCCAAASDTVPGKFVVSHVGRIVTKVGKPLGARVDDLLNSLRDVWFEGIGPALPGGNRVIIEVPSPRVGFRHTGGGYGLAVYGFAAGAVYAMFQGLVGCGDVIAVDTNWMGQRKKEQLQAVALKHYPALARVKDPTHDISDAVALGVWWDQLGRKDHR